METSFIPALAAAGGSIIVAAASVTTSLINQRTQTARELTQARLRERETVYGAFITEASRLAVDALSNSLDSLDKLVHLYGIIGRIRLIASEEVLGEAENCAKRIVALYAQPNITVEQIHAALESDEFDPLKPFSSVCRKELLEISPVR